MTDLSSAFATFREDYRAIYPLPPQPAPATFDRAQIGAALFFIACLTIYAATRTASVIATTEEASGYSAQVAQGLAWLAVVGIEGMLLFMSITHTRQPRLYSQHHAWYLIGLGGAISALAGISSGLGLFDAQLTAVTQAIGGVNIALTLVLGIGATIMVWASGEFVGTALHNVKILTTQAEREYREAVEAYEQILRERWDASPEKAAATHDMEILRAQQQAELDATRLRQEAERQVLQRQAEYDAKYANTGREKGVDRLGLPAQTSVVAAGSNLSQTDLAVQWLESHADPAWRQLDDLPTARQIQEALQTLYQKPFSPASMARARLRYTEAQGW